VGEVAATVGGNATVFEGGGAVTAFDGCGAATVLEICGGAEAVGTGVGEFVGEEVLVDPTGTGWPAGAPCRITTPITIAATAAEAASGMSPVIHRRGGVFSGGVSSFGARSAGPWLWRHWCPASWSRRSISISCSPVLRGGLLYVVVRRSELT
jgi:hypothetical protein